MNDDQRILHQIKEMQALAEELGLETVVAGLENALDSYAQDLRSLGELRDSTSEFSTKKPNSETYNA